MGSVSINFFSEDISFILKEKAHIRQWIKQSITAENKKLKEINFIFCSDSYLLTINNQYLEHDTYTDIITFDNSTSPDFIAGDIFISIDRIIENSSKFDVSIKDELHRVMIHGTLHLLGYLDKSKSAKQIMTQKEDEYLAKRSF